MRVDRERTQRAGEAGELGVELLRPRAANLQLMAERGDAGVDRVQQPEARDLAARELADRGAVGLARWRERLALRVEDPDEAAEELHQSLARPDLETGRDVFRIE